MAVIKSRSNRRKDVFAFAVGMFTTDVGFVRTLTLSKYSRNLSACEMAYVNGLPGMKACVRFALADVKRGGKWKRKKETKKRKSAKTDLALCS